MDFCPFSIPALTRRSIPAVALLACLAAPGAAWGQRTQPPPREAQEAAREALLEFRPKVLEVVDSQNLSTTPASVAELLDLESRIRAVVEKVLPATVGLTIGQAQGSGVIISPDGYVLTAAHVAGRPGNRVTVTLSDGTRYRGVSLGVNRGLDDGLVKITDPNASDLPNAPLGSADALSPGTWTVALGHPGGYQKDRPPVVRVGRILSRGTDFVLTDNTLVGGDSGGPLFDLDGRVIGIHSRIEQGIARNVHVPVDRFLDDWEQLLDSQDMGGGRIPAWMREGPEADDGLRFDSDTREGGARVVRVIPESPAAQAGVQVNDRVIAIDGKPVTNGQDVMLRRMGLRAGEPLKYRIQREDQTLEVEITPVSQRDLSDRAPRVDPNRPVMGVILDFNYGGPGVRLDGVRENGPAAQAGLQAGDIIVSLNGQFLRNAGEMSELTVTAKVGDVVKLTVARGEQKIDVEMTFKPLKDVYPEQLQPRR
jgi:serine protease Do